jgi:hypothetical protein
MTEQTIWQQSLDAAVDAVLAVHASGRYDVAEFAAHVLTTAAAEVGGTGALLARRPGSWEAADVEHLISGTAVDSLPAYRRSPPA